MCISPDCRDPVIVCADDDCEVCTKKHLDCKQIFVNSFVKEIIKKKQEITPVIEEAIQALETLYDDIIERLSDDKNHVLDQIGLLGLSKEEI